eukprot:scaffold17227_cov60-Phaeocystis_antarctica.AAC.1
MRSRRSMEERLERRPVLWHANGKFVLFVHELHEVRRTMDAPCDARCDARYKAPTLALALALIPPHLHLHPHPHLPPCAAGRTAGRESAGPRRTAGRRRPRPPLSALGADQAR